jgi:SNF2 family DNA or RNA helicase
MALPPLLKHIYNFGSEEVVKRGKKIFLLGGVQLLMIEEISNQASFRVRNDLYHNYYTVTISRFDQEHGISVRCQCPYNMGDICRHEVAALFHLNDLMVTQQLDTTVANFNQAHTVVRMRQIELKLLRLFAGDTNYSAAENISLSIPPKITSAANERVTAEYELQNEKFNVSIQRNDDRTFNTACNCHDIGFALCVHKTALFLQLINNYGSSYFDTIRNWDTQKNKLLQQYGFSLNDNLDGKFEFVFSEGRQILRVLDGSIKKINTEYNLATAQNNSATEIIETDFVNRIGIVINANEKNYPYFSIDIIEGEYSEGNPLYIGTIKKIDINKYVPLEKYPPTDRVLLSSARKIIPSEVHKYISKNSSFGDMWQTIVVQEGEAISVENKKLYAEFILPKLKNIFTNASAANFIYYLPLGKKFVTNELIKIDVALEPYQLSFDAKINKNNLEINSNIILPNQSKIQLQQNAIGNALLVLHNNRLYLPSNVHAALQIEEIENMDVQNPNILQEVLLPLSKKYTVAFDKSILETNNGDISAVRLYLSEQTDNFILTPSFVYANTEAFYNGERTINTIVEGKLHIINRDSTSEEEWVQQLQKLSNHFKWNASNGSLGIHAQHALKGNWFFTFFETLKEWKVQIFGFEQLRRFKINRTKPNTSIQVASGVDWFDTEVNLDFEGQIANIDEVRKALSVKRNYVQLGDGSYGLLPEEWLAKYSLLFKMSEVQDGKLRVSKYNFSIIDELYDVIDDETVRKELEEKKNNLLQLTEASQTSVPLPEGLLATLRPYQESGYNWLAYLDKVNWGGLLADDMGLGKTVQTLTFLQHFEQKNNTLMALVVCPTTLIYNWQNEILKFTPNLTYLVHHSTGRSRKVSDLENFNIIITTYGTLRSDIELLLKINFDYVVLDESQSIKNPTSKVTKAAMLLNTKNRIALSGTPMQNNTFDIYAQLNFLNPGMLGSKDFFKDNFATPIDKFQEATTKQHLRKLIYPFLLRRTKEQVAKDLPDKTEITLYCEMGKEQKLIYTTYRDMYRAKILGTIDDQGVEKSQFAILQGLMKLRQICDSPAILKEEIKLPNHSVKLDELVTQLKENIGNHKVLIFSQYLGMLALIKEKLTEADIVFEYFDGSCTAKQRQDSINNFQDNETCRAFLISLKAGGTGLNLTAADYVYIIDPWWNPAVEQQAIDRTHRIGQTKNIFAYRFICKDTIEEKIVELKQRKSSLVRDIVADDDGFVKTLTKEDVMYLFSE